MNHPATATGLAQAIRDGELTAEEVVAGYLERGAASELNAFTELDAEGARHAARAILPGDPRPLAGVPIAIKDLFDHVGHTTTAGSSFLRIHPTNSAATVDRLIAAGAVIIGRTGLHEFAFGFSSENHWFGPVHNPWDPATSPGGSSGGSATAVAGGLSAAALGTDTGGSVRVPAALCGLTGLKVTHGRVSTRGVFPLAPSLDTVGPITLDVTDAALLYGILAGYDPDDPWSQPVSVARPDGPLSLEGVRFSVPQPFVDQGPTDTTVRAAFSRFLDLLPGHGVHVEETRSPSFGFDERLLASAYGDVAAVHREFRRDAANTYGPDVEARLAACDVLTLDEYVDALRWRAELRQAAAVLFGATDFVVTPATGTTRKTIGVDTVDIDGEPTSYRPVLSWFSAPVNHAGLPALVVPIHTEGNPPPAIQFIAPWWAEDRLIALGLALEDAGLVGSLGLPLTPLQR